MTYGEAPRWQGPTAVPAPAPPPPEPYRVSFDHLSKMVQTVLVLAVVTMVGLATVAGLGVNYWLSASQRDRSQEATISKLAKANAALAKAEAHDHYTIGQDGVGISTIYNDVKPLLPFSTTCSQFFANGKTGQPATYEMPCTPAGSSSSNG